MIKRKFRRSPLFYVGDKYKLLNEIVHLFPKSINRFFEPFVGGGSVFLNVLANEYVLNDKDKYLIELHKLLLNFRNNNKEFFKKLYEIINYYGFSQSFKKDIVPIELKKKFPKTYYARFNKEAFEKLKKDFNEEKERDYFKLFVLLIYGFNRMLRFNSNGNFNLPVGNVDFNSNVVNALYDYFLFTKNKKIKFYNFDYLEFLNFQEFKVDDFIYFDPPYLITNSEYNKYWTVKDEENLINFLDSLNQKKIKFAISNVIRYKERHNSVFENWSKKYNTFEIKSNYISYHDNSLKEMLEVLVTNYIPKIDSQEKLFEEDISFLNK